MSNNNKYKINAKLAESYGGNIESFTKLITFNMIYIGVIQRSACCNIIWQYFYGVTFSE